jgi:hypothetical protein
MVEVIWVSLFGAALAWLQMRSAPEDPVEVRTPVDEEWTRWEQELFDWREQ